MVYTYDQLKEAIDKVSKKHCNNNPPKRSEMAEYGDISPSTYRNRFSSWSEALEEFGYVANKKKVGFTEEELLEDLKRIMKIDSVPVPLRGKDIDEHSKYSHGTYENYFGGISNAIERLGIEPRTWGLGEDHWCWVDGYESCYGKNWWKQRKKAWQRDNYRCAICGNKNNGELENPDVHHIEPSSNFESDTEYEEMNSLDNLVCLCRTHHNQFEGKWEDLDYQTFVQRAKEQA